MLAGKSNFNGSILVVEDDPGYATLLREAFSEAGFETLEASNGEAALKQLREHQVDLVVSDFMMPELNGLELCRLVSEDAALSLVRVVVYSCNPDTAFRKKARELGALDYLPRSDDAGALVARVCEVAGIEPQGLAETPADGHHAEEAVQSAFSEIRQLRLLIDNLLDFIQIAALDQASSPGAQVAREAAHRTGDDMRRILNDLEQQMEQLRAPVLT